MKKVILKSLIAFCVIAFAASFAGCDSSETPFGRIDEHKIKNFVVKADTSGVVVEIESKSLVKKMRNDIGENKTSYRSAILINGMSYGHSFVIEDYENNIVQFHFIQSTSQPDSVAVLSEISQKSFIFDGKTGKYVREISR